MLKAFIIGASGFAKEVYNWIDHEKIDVVGFLDETAEYKRVLFGKTVHNKIDEFSGCINVIFGIGDTKLRESFYNKLKDTHKFISVIHKSAIIGQNVLIQDGVVICPNVVITTDCVIKTGCLLNLGVTIGHDCLIGPFCTASPGANISGNCKIGKRVYVGTNSAIREKIEICDDVVIGMGAVVVKSIKQEDAGIYVGNPAVFKG